MHSLIPARSECLCIITANGGKVKQITEIAKIWQHFLFLVFFSSFYIKYGLLKGNTLKFKRSRLLMGSFDCLILISLNTKTQLICNLTAMALCRICPQNKKRTWQLCAWLTIFWGRGEGRICPHLLQYDQFMEYYWYYQILRVLTSGELINHQIIPHCF